MTTPLTLVPPSAPVLWTRAAPVTDIVTQVLPHLVSMMRLMVAKRGIGLAAPQVGIPFAFFVTALPECAVVINPSILCRIGWSVEEEGCLSFPGQRRPVQRPQRVWAEWKDEDGRLGDTVLRDMAARVFLHEADHLEGRCLFARPSQAVGG